MRMAAILFLVGSLFSAHRAAGQATRTRDSAGVRIVDNPSRVSHPVNLHLADKPALDVGGLQDNPDDEFDPRQGYLRGVLLTGGGLAVIDVSRVQYFDAHGKRVRIVGRNGAGPADFGYLLAVCRTRGDIVVVGDSRNRRMSVIGADGQVTGTLQELGHGVPSFDFCFDDGTILLERDLPTALGTPTTTRLTRIKLDGTGAQLLGDFDSGLFDMVTQQEAAVVAAGKHFYFGNGATSELREYDTAGRLEAIIRSDDPPQEITGAEVEARLASTIPTNVSSDERNARLARMHALPHANTWPTFGSVHVDPAQRIWMEDYRRTYPSADGWSVFDSSGKLIGRFVLPAPAKGILASQVIGFGDGTVLIRHQDDDGAAHLTEYAIEGLGRARP